MPLLNRRGTSLAELMVVTTIIGVAGIALGTVFKSSFDTVNDVKSRLWVENVRREIVTSLRDKDAWAKTIADPANTSLACLRAKLANPLAPVQCSGAGGAIAVVRDRNDRVIHTSAAATSGFSKAGIACNAFDAANGNEDCPYRFEVRWTAVCADATCPQPDALVEGDLIYKSNAQVESGPRNTAALGFRTLITTRELNESTCEQSMLGNFSGGKCQLKVAQSCPSGQYTVGFQKDGSPICRQVNYDLCPGGLYKGMDTSGNPICESRSCI